MKRKAKRHRTAFAGLIDDFDKIGEVAIDTEHIEKMERTLTNFQTTIQKFTTFQKHLEKMSQVKYETRSQCTAIVVDIQKFLIRDELNGFEEGKNVQDLYHNFAGSLNQFCDSGKHEKHYQEFIGNHRKLHDNIKKHIEQALSQKYTELTNTLNVLVNDCRLARLPRAGKLLSMYKEDHENPQEYFLNSHRELQKDFNESKKDIDAYTSFNAELDKLQQEMTDHILEYPKTLINRFNQLEESMEELNKQINEYTGFINTDDRLSNQRTNITHQAEQHRTYLTGLIDNFNKIGAPGGITNEGKLIQFEQDGSEGLPQEKYVIYRGIWYDLSWMPFFKEVTYD